MSKTGPGGTRLPSVVRQLGIVSFFNDFASEMVYPLLPTLVTGRLGGTALALGALDGVAEGVAAMTKLLSGKLADRHRYRRPLVIVGYAIATATRPLMAVAGAVWQIVALRGGDRVGKGLLNPARDAVIADATPAALRGRAFGFHRAMDHGGAVLGPVVAWLLLAKGWHPEAVIAWSVVPGLIAVGVVAWALRYVPQGGRSAPPPRSVVPRRQSRFLFSLIVAFAFARTPETLLLLRLQDLGVAVAVIPMLWAGLHVVRSSASYPGGWLSDRIGPRRTMVLGWCLYGVVCAGLAVSTSVTAAVGWFTVFGVVAATTEGPERAFIAGVNPEAKRGTGFGIYHAAVGMAALPGSLAIGAVYAAMGGSLAFLCSGAIVLTLAVFGSLGSDSGPLNAGRIPQ